MTVTANIAANDGGKAAQKIAYMSSCGLPTRALTVIWRQTGWQWPNRDSLCISLARRGQGFGFHAGQPGHEDAAAGLT